MRKDRRARAAGLFSESSLVKNAEFLKMRPDATKINPAAASCNSGQGEVSSQKALINFKRYPKNHDSKQCKGLAADVLHRLLSRQALGSMLSRGWVSFKAMFHRAIHGAAFSLRGGYDAVSLTFAWA